MSLFQAKKDPRVMSIFGKIAALLVMTFAWWSIGAPTFMSFANAAQLTNVSDTISNSELSVAAKHTVAFTATDAINAGDTIKISLDPVNTSPGTSAFSESFSAATSSDIFLTGGATSYSIVTSCTAGNQATVVGNYNGGSDENLTFTICGGASAISASSAVSIVVGSTTPLWTNPAGTGSYVVRIGGTMSNSGDARVAVLNNVVVTASVDTSFTFTVTGLATSSVYNGITTTGSTTATALPFNTLTPGASSTLGQTLSVATNARNGFAVTVQENQPLTSSTGAEIALFKDGATTSVPTAWTHPSNTLNSPQTFGHLGVSSDDSNEGSGEFVANGGSQYAGNIINPRQVFSNNGPSDGTTQDVGLAHVLYTIEIGTLQPAGNDYTNTLTYVATPTF